METPKNKTPRMAFILALDLAILIAIVVLTIRSGFEDFQFAWFILFWLFSSHLYLYWTNRRPDLPADSDPH